MVEDDVGRGRATARRLGRRDGAPRAGLLRPQGAPRADGTLLRRDSFLNVSAKPGGPIERKAVMLWTIAVILLVLWLLGFSLHVAGGLIHILLVIAVVVGLIQLFSGRRSV